MSAMTNGAFKFLFHLSAAVLALTGVLMLSERIAPRRRNFHRVTRIFLFFMAESLLHPDLRRVAKRTVSKAICILWVAMAMVIIVFQSGFMYSLLSVGDDQVKYIY